jgi:hypothetical protein
VSFADVSNRREPPRGDILVWELEIPPEAEGAVVAICDGYEYELQLRSKMGGRKGAFAAWGAPAFRDEIETLLAYLARRYGVESAGPRPFSDADLAAGMHLAPRRNKDENEPLQKK